MLLSPLLKPIKTSNSKASDSVIPGLIIIGLLLLPILVSASPSFTDQIEVQLEEMWVQDSSTEGSSAGDSSINTRAKIKSLQQGYQAPACPSGFKIHHSQALKAGRNGIQVTCPDIKSWQLYLAVEIQQWQPIVVLSSALKRGESIGRHHIALKRQNTANLAKDYFTQKQDVLGQISKRSLKAGTILSSDMMNLPILVKKREHVTLISKTRSLRVEMKGQALKSGRMGDIIPVRNLKSKKVLQARVIAAGQVQVN